MDEQNEVPSKTRYQARRGIECFQITSVKEWDISASRLLLGASTFGIINIFGRFVTHLNLVM